jgi:hypothetical protein
VKRTAKGASSWRPDFCTYFAETGGQKKVDVAAQRQTVLFKRKAVDFCLGLW